jgi:DNA replication and repair protein RecF
VHLLRFELVNWRNIAVCAVEPGPTINVFHGDNAQGKTNLIEGIYYVATLRTFRPGRRSQLARWGSPGAQLKARAEVEGRTVSFEVGLAEGNRHLAVDGAPVEATDDYFGGFNVVLFTPEHLALVRGEPAGRRAFVDRALFNVDASQLRVVRRYNRVLRERNALLKQTSGPGRGRGHGVNADLLDALDDQLARAGAVLVVRRLELLEELSPGLDRVHAQLTPNGKSLRLRYRARGLGDTLEEPREEPWTRLLNEGLRDRRDEDLRRGFTSVGPHADDVQVLLDDRPARLVASQGETRTIVLALKLAEVSWVNERRTEPPVLLLDDMGSELDENRRRVLFEYIGQMQCQTFVTTVSPRWVVTGKNNKYFQIIEGDVTTCGSEEN